MNCPICGTTLLRHDVQNRVFYQCDACPFELVTWSDDDDEDEDEDEDKGEKDYFEMYPLE